MTRVVAQGTFDVVHPGHIHYLSEAAEMGDELYVIVARTDNISHKADPILTCEQRTAVVGKLEMVDEALEGHPTDIFSHIRDIDPDVIVLGHDQHHDDEDLERALATNGIDCAVERASPHPNDSERMILSSSTIIKRAIEQRSGVKPPTPSRGGSLLL